MKLLKYSFLILAILISVEKAHATKPSDLVSLSPVQLGHLGIQITQEEEAVRIQTDGPSNLNLTNLDLSGKNLENTRFVFTASAKSKDLTEKAYLELWLHFGEKAYFGRGLKTGISGTSDWKEISTHFVTKAGQIPDKIVANIVFEDKGTVWLKDINLRPVPKKKK